MGLVGAFNVCKPGNGIDGKTGDVQPLMTSKEAARLLHVSEATLSRWRTSRTGPPHVNLNGIPRYRAEDLGAWISGNLENA